MTGHRRSSQQHADSDLTLEDKVTIIQSVRRFSPVMTMGDGVDDAPTQAAADVAIGTHGTASSSEVAGVALLVDELRALQ